VFAETGSDAALRYVLAAPGRGAQHDVAEVALFAFPPLLDPRLDALLARLAFADVAAAAPALERAISDSGGSCLDPQRRGELARRAARFLALAKEVAAVGDAGGGGGGGGSSGGPGEALPLVRFQGAVRALGSARDLIELARLSARRPKRPERRTRCAWPSCPKLFLERDDEEKRRCAQCLSAYYCDKAHKRAAYEAHRYMCPVLKQARAEAGVDA
jgi:hypothetical protein